MTARKRTTRRSLAETTVLLYGSQMVPFLCTLNSESLSMELSSTSISAILNSDVKHSRFHPYAIPAPFLRLSL